MTNYAILRTAKLNSWGNISGSMGHTYRHAGMAPNADPVRLGKNKVLVGRPGDGVADIRNRIDGLAGKPRANAVLCVEFMLTMSSEWAEGKTAKQIDVWASRNIAFLQKQFGKENVRHAVLHNDESTPHIVAYVVPERDGKLNCRSYLGGREKLTQLQSDYAVAMSSMKLERGVEGSKARHRTVKNFYTSLNQIETAAVNELKKIADPARPPEPSLKSLLVKGHREAELQIWEKQEKQRTSKVVKTASQSIVRAKTLWQEVEVLKEANGALSAEIEGLKERLSSLYEQLELPKDEISKLRKLDISAVAERLEYFEVIEKGENAIDLVKRVNGFDYGQSVAWLHDEFGAASAAQAVRENLDVSPPERPLTKAENTIKRAIKTQLDALGCDKYRISLIASNGKGAPYLPGKIGDEERFYSRNDIENLVRYLRYENNVGQRHIYITPMDDNAYYVLLDDVRSTPKKLAEDGYKPCLIQSTSWKSMQAVFKLPKDGVDRKAVIDVFNEMNKEMGDPSITGLRHPMRLAGFRNMKEKHLQEGQYPFVRVLEAVNRYCKKTLDLVLQKQQKLISPTLDVELQDQTLSVRPRR